MGHARGETDITPKGLGFASDPLFCSLPDVAALCKGDIVRHGKKDYGIVGKRFDADVFVTKFALREVIGEPSSRMVSAKQTGRRR